MGQPPGLGVAPPVQRDPWGPAPDETVAAEELGRRRRERLAGGLAGVGEGVHAELGRELHVVVSLVRLAAGESCTIAITCFSILLLQATTNLSSECGSTDTRAACRN